VVARWLVVALDPESPERLVPQPTGMVANTSATTPEIAVETADIRGRTLGTLIILR
jgi:hypothetical protein